MAQEEGGKPVADRATALNNLADTLDAIGDRRAAASARARARANG